MYVICEKQVKDEILNKVARRCSMIIGAGGAEWPDHFEEGYDFTKFFHVDIHCLSLKRLKYLPPMSRYVDIKKAKLLVGKELFHLINIDERKLPVAEGIRILVNRMMALFLSMKVEYLKRKLGDDEKRALNYYISKAYISCAEALLIYSRDYCAGYELRADVFSKIYKKKFSDLYNVFPDLSEKVLKFTSYKIVPNPKSVDSINEWFECQKRIVGVYDYLVKKMNEKGKFEYLYYQGYARYVLSRMNLNFKLFRFLFVFMLESYLSFRYFIRLRGELGGFYFRAFSFSDPGMSIIKATALVLSSISKDGSSDKNKLKRALILISSVFPVCRSLDCSSVKADYLRAYRTYFLQRFV